MSSVLSLFLLSTIFAAPVQNVTATATFAPPWVPDPQGRGAWSLLHSYISTLVLCVWTSIHLNVPPPDDTRRAYWLPKIKWLLVALLAPEMVVFSAFQQWYGVRDFLKKLNVMYAESEDRSSLLESEAPKSQMPFDMTYAQFAVMGGFAVDVSHLHNKLTRATITTDGMLFLASQGHFIRQSTNSIRDKSKADGIAKALVCVQVLWVCGQAVERKIACLPVTLLEIHTIVHVICALVIYALWIQKPLNVQDPLLVNAERFQAPLALMVCAMKLTTKDAGHIRYYHDFFKGKRIRSFMDPYLAWYKNLEWNHVALRVPVKPGNIFSYRTEQDLKNWNMSDSWVKLPLHGQSNDTVTTYTEGILRTADGDWHICSATVVRYLYLPNTTFEMAEPASIGVVASQALACGIGPGSGDFVVFSPKDIRRLELAAEFVSAKLENSQSYQEPFTQWETAIQPHHARLVAPSEPNMMNIFFNLLADESVYKAILSIAVMVMIPCAYGGVHLAALRIMFPTVMERLVWKISCYIIIGFGAWFGALIAMAGAFGLRNCGVSNLLYPLLGEGAPLFSRYEIRSSIVPWLCAALYMSARLYIVAESFASLRHVPAGVFETPDINLMNYIPHI